jgi:hypothetical protein
LGSAIPKPKQKSPISAEVHGDALYYRLSFESIRDRILATSFVDAAWMLTRAWVRKPA